MLDSDLYLEGCGQFFNIGGAAFYRNDFKTLVMIEVNMLGGNDGLLKVMLNIKEHADQFSLVVVISHNDRSGNSAALLPLFSCQLFTDKVPYRFRTAFVPLSFDMTIKRFDERFIKGDTESVKITHALVSLFIKKSGWQCSQPFLPGVPAYDTPAVPISFA